MDYRAVIAVVRSGISSMQALGDAGDAWPDLAIRFWLAKGFLVAAGLSTAKRAPLTLAFASTVSFAWNHFSTKRNHLRVQLFARYGHNSDRGDVQ
jgi:hypothetical protein